MLVLLIALRSSPAVRLLFHLSSQERMLISENSLRRPVRDLDLRCLKQFKTLIL